MKSGTVVVPQSTMQRTKACFISTWLALLMSGIARATWKLAHGGLSADWLAALIAAALPVLFFAWLFVFDVARTRFVMRAIIAIEAADVAWLLLVGDRGTEVWLWTAIVGLAGAALYEWWYSSFGTRAAGDLAVGQRLPDLEFVQVDGSIFSTANLGRPMLLMFYRGNWCPLCMAQVREVAASYRDLASRGVEVLLVSPQPAAHSEALARRFDVPMKFLVDANNRMASLLGIKASAGLPAGLEALGYDSDTVFPTVIIADSTSRVIYSDLTSDYRIRPEPAAFLTALNKAGI